MRFCECPQTFDSIFYMLRAYCVFAFYVLCLLPESLGFLPWPLTGAFPYFPPGSDNSVFSCPLAHSPARPSRALPPSRRSPSTSSTHCQRQHRIASTPRGVLLAEKQPHTHTRRSAFSTYPASASAPGLGPLPTSPCGANCHWLTARCSLAVSRALHIVLLAAFSALSSQPSDPDSLGEPQPGTAQPGTPASYLPDFPLRTDDGPSGRGTGQRRDKSFVF